MAAPSKPGFDGHRERGCITMSTGSTLSKLQTVRDDIQSANADGAEFGLIAKVDLQP